MSVNLLSNPSSPVKISDELESFFHVLLYYCVRYLRSNCPCPTSFIENYFNEYAGPGRLYTCGWKSFAIEDNEPLSNQFPPCRLLFYSPIDEVIDTILKDLQSLYKVRKDEARKAKPPPPPSPPPAISCSVPVEIPDIRFWGEDAKRPTYKPPPPPPDEVPTLDDRERAKKALDHKFIIEHITRILSSSKWPDDDRVHVSAVEPK